MTIEAAWIPCNKSFSNTCQGYQKSQPDSEFDDHFKLFRGIVVAQFKQHFEHRSI